MGERYHYWSNGTEGRAWEANWCHGCENDHHATHVGTDADFERGCPILARALIEDDHRTIPELVESDKPHPRPVDQGVVCLAFAPCRWCDEGSDDPPKPVVPIPGQTTIDDFVPVTVGPPVESGDGQ